MLIKTKLLRLIRLWHARIGVLSALFFILLAVSGLMLNHTTSLNLDKKMIGTHWLMHWYGLKSTTPNSGYVFDNGYFVVADGRWVMDHHFLKSDTSEPVIGVAAWGELRAIATPEALYLYTQAGQLVDKVSGNLLPNSQLQQLGLLDKALVIKTTLGEFSTQDGVTWTELKNTHVLWSKPQALPSDTLIDLQQKLAPTLPLERIVLDLHSGRIFGTYGVFLMDIAAILLMVLSLSGIWVYWHSIHK
ncbi:MAG: hypothetical protein HOP21_10775 [Methylotenera sp.]|nr:hypothetical protein [Methylotenera sp.]